MVANLSRFGQAVELDLAGYAGTTLVELFGRTPFWPVTDEPYRLTIGPHAFFWFALVKDGVPAAGAGDSRLVPPQLETAGPWRVPFQEHDRRLLEEALLGYLANQPWFRGAAESVLQVSVIDAVPLETAGARSYLMPVRVVYADHDSEVALLGAQVMPGVVPTPERRGRR